MNEIQNYSFICQTDKFISIKNRNDESIINKIIIFCFFIIAVIAMQLRTLRVFIGLFMIT
jgi:hypothetical protein